MDRTYALFGLVEAIFSPLALGLKQPYNYIVPSAMIGDGVLAALWTLWHDQSVSSSESWESSNQTGTCSR